MKEAITCPQCGAEIERYRNPFPTVDIIIDLQGRLVLVRRRNPPVGWALPGGFIDYGESAPAAAVREAKEETGLDVELKGLLGVYSEPTRDPRFHTLSVVFVASATGRLAAGDDAADAVAFPLEALPESICFDHARIIADYKDVLAGRRGLCMVGG